MSADPALIARIMREAAPALAAESQLCRSRRARVLAHPDLARRLCDPPLSFSDPAKWNGFVAPAQWQGRHNNSPCRAQVIALLEAVAVREKDPERVAIEAPVVSDDDPDELYDPGYELAREMD